MGLCKTSNVSIFTFTNASDLKFCTRSYSSCINLIMRFKGSNEKNGKMMTTHFRTLLAIGLGNCVPQVKLNCACLTTLPSGFLTSLICG